MTSTKKITTTDVKRLNKNTIFRLIHFAGKISRQEIADILKLSLPTVNQNLKLLLEEKLIVFGGNFDSTGGRKAQVIMVNEQGKFAVSLNIFPGKVKVSLIDLNGDVVCAYEKNCGAPNDAGYGEAVADMVNHIIKTGKASPDDVLGVGITIPGIFDSDNEVVVSAPIMGLHNFELSDITKHINFKCLALNDAKSKAYSEYWYEYKNAEKPMTKESFNNSIMPKAPVEKIYLMLDEGVGGAFIRNQHVVAGRHNRSGEFGHMTIHPGGRKCFCGKTGCFESYVSKRCLSDDLGLSLSEFFEKLKAGDENIKKHFAGYLDDLTTGINNIYTMTDNDIVIVGAVAHYLYDYQDEIKEILAKKSAFDTSADYLTFARCTDEMSQAGAALMFLGDFISRI